jgi:hypothetical protein
VTFVLDQMRGQFADTNSRIDNLVTRDAFVQEQARVNERLMGHDRELGELKGALQAEATARVAAETALGKERSDEAKLREKERANRGWLIFGMFATPIAGAIVLWVLNGGLIT